MAAGIRFLAVALALRPMAAGASGIEEALALFQDGWTLLHRADFLFGPGRNGPPGTPLCCRADRKGEEEDAGEKSESRHTVIIGLVPLPTRRWFLASVGA